MEERRGSAQMASTLRRPCFAEVIEEADLDRVGFLRALRSFEKAAADADWAVVYYSSYGMAINGTNYLIPIDAKLDDPDVARDEAVPLDRLTEKGGDAKRSA